MKILLHLLLFLLFQLVIDQPARAESNRAALSILADESLTLPLSEIARRFSLQYQMSVTCAYAPPLQNMRQIEEGASADLFITAYASLLDRLRRKGLTDVYSRRRIAEVRLVLVKSTGRKEPEISQGIVVPSPTLNPEGQYAEHYLESLIPSLPLRYVASPFLLAGALESSGLAGMTYDTEIGRLGGLAPVSAPPPNPPPPVAFEAVVVAGENMNASRSFMAYLASSEARATFKRYGFLTE